MKNLIHTKEFKSGLHENIRVFSANRKRDNELKEK